MTFALIHRDVLSAIARLTDPEQSVALPIVKGQAPGELSVLHCLVPPRGVHRRELANEFTVELQEGVLAKISVMTGLVAHEPGNFSIVGFHLQGLTDKMVAAIPSDRRWKFESAVVGNNAAVNLFVGVNLRTPDRSGFVYLSKSLHALIREHHREEIEQAEEREERIGRAALRLR